MKKYEELSAAIDSANTLAISLGQRSNIIGHTTLIFTLKGKTEEKYTFDVIKGSLKTEEKEIDFHVQPCNDDVIDHGNIASLSLKKDRNKAKEMVKTCLEAGQQKYHLLFNNCRHYVKKSLQIMKEKNLIPSFKFKIAWQKITVIQILDKFKGGLLPVYLSAKMLNEIVKVISNGYVTVLEALKNLIFFLVNNASTNAIKYPVKLAITNK